MEKPDPKLDRLPPEVTENIAEYLQGDHESLEAFRALRLTCKELYLKTFRVFAIAYFTNLSVAFNLISLNRLRDVANHKNSFGLSLYTFPRTLTCSTYRLPTGNAVKKCLLITSDPARMKHGDEVADAISRACQKGSGLFGSFLAPYDRPRARDLARRYMNATEEQGHLESTGDDVKLLATGLAGFPNIKSIGASADRHAWGQDDWDKLAGIRIESFLYMEYLATGETNLTVITRKLLAAVAEAGVLCKSRGGHLVIERLCLHGKFDRKCEGLELGPVNLQLHKLNFPDTLQSRLKDALSRLKRLCICVCWFTKDAPPATDYESELQQSKVALQTLFSSPATEEVFLNLLDHLPTNVTELVSIEDELIGMAMKTQPFTSLRSIELYGPSLHLVAPAISQYVRTHATTLKKLRLVGRRSNDIPDVDASREFWRPVLRAAAGCAELADLIVLIRSGDPDMHDVDINVEEKANVSELLAKVVVSPTEPGKEMGWVR
jgi:hypothetical protein